MWKRKQIAMTFSVRRDFDRYPEVRRLQAILAHSFPSAHILASHIFMQLWKELAYQAEMNALGDFPKAEFGFFFDALNISSTGLTAEIMTDVLLKSGLLKEYEKTYFCPIFFADNTNLSREYKAPSVTAHEVRTLKIKKDKYEKKAEKEALSMPEDYFSEVDGKPVEKFEMNRAIVLIRVIDSILCRPERAKPDFGVGIVHDACRVVRRFDPGQLDAIHLRMLTKRRTPALPRSTEHFLSNIDSCLLKLNPDDAWMQLAKINVLS
jgi:hypothetical protein